MLNSRSQVFLGMLLLVSDLGGLFSCSGDGAGFHVQFDWDDKPPEGAVLYAVARVEHAPNNKLQSILASAGPDELRPNLELSFSDVPVGKDRRVVVEIRQEPGSAAQISYYGMSQLFELDADSATTVPVRLQLKAAPGQKQRPTELGLALDGPDAALPRKDSLVSLLASSDTGKAVELSNIAGFPKGATERFDFAELEAADGDGEQRSYRLQWDVERGVSESERCGEVDFCPRTVFARFLDDEGYASAVYELRVVIDRAPPDVLSAETLKPTVSPVEGSLLVKQGLADKVKILGAGSVLGLSFAMREPVSDVRVTARDSGTGLELSFEQESGNEITFVFKLTYGADAPARLGTVFEVLIEATDLAGNTGTSILGGETSFTIDTVPPALADASDAAALTYIRRPYGPDAQGRANPYFALRGGPRSVEPDAIVLIFDGPDLDTAQRLGDAVADGEGALEQELTRRDVPQVYAVTVDAAGNHSAPTLVRRVDWTANFKGRVAGQATGNPHRFDNRGWFMPSLARAGIEVNGDASGLGADKPSVRVFGGGRWEGTSLGDAPDSRKFPRAAYDRARGQLVVFGGRKVTGPDCDGTGNDLCSGPWEWDGRRWELRRLADGGGGFPPAREEHAMAWDAKRGLTVIFGGRGPLNCEVAGLSFCGDTWGYDGTRFTRLTDGDAERPSRRTWTTLAYDELRDRMVLFGGFADSPECAQGTPLCDDTWEWDGSAWERIARGGGPSPRKGHASAYDPVSHSTLVFGGIGPGDAILGDTWAWDGQTWRELSAAPSGGSAPSARQDAAMTYSDRLGRVVLYGGDANGASCDGATACGTLWSFDGQRWEPVALASQTLRPPGLTHATLGEDAFGNVVLLGGDSNDGVYTFRDGHYRERSGVLTPEGPVGRQNPKLAHDPVGGMSVLFGGKPSDGGESCPTANNRCNDSWTWDGSGWSAASASAPALCEGASLSYDASSGDAILLGGRTAAAADCTTAYLFDFDTRAWSAGPELFATGDNTRPASRQGHTIAELADGLVLLGGRLGTELSDVWRLSNGAWSRLPDLPAGRAFGAASRFGQDQLVHFGGEYAGACNGDGIVQNNRCVDGQTFVMAGDSWQANNPSAAKPPPRTFSSMIHVDARGAPLLFGGESAADCGSGADECNDLWEFRSDGWHQVQPADPEGDGSPFVRVRHTMVYDRLRSQALLFGGEPGKRSSATEAFGDTWLWHPGHDTMPGQVARFSFGSTLAPADTAIGALELRWSADARAEGAEGAQLWAFYRGRFQKVEDVGLEPVGDGVWRATDPEILNGLLFGADRIFGFAQTPRGFNGRLPEYAWVETRAIELRVEYVLPEERED